MDGRTLDHVRTAAKIPTFLLKLITNRFLINPQETANLHVDRNLFSSAYSNNIISYEKKISLNNIYYFHITINQKIESPYEELSSGYE